MPTVSVTGTGPYTVTADEYKVVISREGLDALYALKADFSTLDLIYTGSGGFFRLCHTTVDAANYDLSVNGTYSLEEDTGTRVVVKVTGNLRNGATSRGTGTFYVTCYPDRIDIYQVVNFTGGTAYTSNPIYVAWDDNRTYATYKYAKTLTADFIDAEAVNASWTTVTTGAGPWNLFMRNHDATETYFYSVAVILQAMAGYGTLTFAHYYSAGVFVGHRINQASLSGATDYKCALQIDFLAPVDTDLDVGEAKARRISWADPDNLDGTGDDGEVITGTLKTNATLDTDADGFIQAAGAYAITAASNEIVVKLARDNAVAGEQDFFYPAVDCYSVSGSAFAAWSSADGSAWTAMVDGTDYNVQRAGTNRVWQYLGAAFTGPKYFRLLWSTGLAVSGAGPYTVEAERYRVVVSKEGIDKLYIAEAAFASRDVLYLESGGFFRLCLVSVDAVNYDLSVDGTYSLEEDTGTRVVIKVTGDLRNGGTSRGTGTFYVTCYPDRMNIYQVVTFSGGTARTAYELLVPWDDKYASAAYKYSAALSDAFSDATASGSSYSTVTTGTGPWNVLVLAHDLASANYYSINIACQTLAGFGTLTFQHAKPTGYIAHKLQEASLSAGVDYKSAMEVTFLAAAGGTLDTAEAKARRISWADPDNLDGTGDDGEVIVGALKTDHALDDGDGFVQAAGAWAITDAGGAIKVTFARDNGVAGEADFFRPAIQCYSVSGTEFAAERSADGDAWVTLTEGTDYRVQVSGDNRVWQYLGADFTGPLWFRLTWGSVPEIDISGLDPWQLNGRVGHAYSAMLSVIGGTPPTTIKAVGALPAGLSVATSGLISGVPETAGAGSYTFKVEDSLGFWSTKLIPITIYEALAISTESLPQGEVGLSYSEVVESNAASGTQNWSLASGALPDDLFGDNGNPDYTISGTPTVAGTFPFTAHLYDTDWLVPPDTADKALSITILARVEITTATLDSGVEGDAYSDTVVASGGLLPLEYTVTAGALPDGLILFPSTGEILGVTTADGVFNFTVTVTDSWGVTDDAALSISIVAPPAPLMVVTGELAGGEVGVFYTATLVAGGGTSPYTWGLIAGAFPDGLTLSSEGVLQGDPSVAGVFTFTVEVTDDVAATDSKELSITVIAGPTITTASLPGATLGLPYSTNLAASGGTPPYHWYIGGGGLPDGIVLAESGTIYGMPTILGEFIFAVDLYDSLGAQVTKELSITVWSAPVITTLALPPGSIGVAYSASVVVEGGTLPLVWTVVGALPTGLTLDGDTGVISGTPSAAGDWPFTITVEDALAAEDSQQYTITIAAPPVITTITLPDGTLGRPYTATLSALGGAAPLVWSFESGRLPDGLTLDPATGAISGIPQWAREFTLAIRVTDDDSVWDVKGYTLTVHPPVTIVVAGGDDEEEGEGSPGGDVDEPVIAFGFGYGLTWGAPDDGEGGGASSISIEMQRSGMVDRPYEATITAVGGTPPYAWTIVAGSLPGGVTLHAATGTLSGRVTAAPGVYTFTVRVTEGWGGVDEAQCSIQIYPTAIFAPGGHLLVRGGKVVSAGKNCCCWFTPRDATLGTSWSPSYAVAEVEGTCFLPMVPLERQMPDDAVRLAVFHVDGTTPQVADAWTRGYSGGLYHFHAARHIYARARTTFGDLSRYHDGRFYYFGTAEPTLGLPLPPGLTLDSETGVISGTPTEAGEWLIIVGVNDIYYGDTKQFTISISD